MKKFLSVLLVVILALSLAACGKINPAKDLDNVKKEGKLKIGYTLYSPMNYKDDNGEFVGFDTEYAKAVCEKLGVEPEFIEINWDTKEIELDSGNIDCIWNGFTINDERKEQVDFSTPYIKNKQVVVIKKENAEKYTDTASLSGANLTAETKSAGESAIAGDENLKKATYTAVAKQTDGLLEVASGTSDAVVLDYTLAFANVGKGNYTDLMIIEGLDLGVEEYGIGFRKGSSLTQEVNKITAELIKDGTMEKIAEKYDLSAVLLK